MQQAIERVSKSLEMYGAGALSRTLATIELVSAFKVVSKSLAVSPEELQTSVTAFVNAVLTQLDENKISTDEAVAELARVYEAAHNDDPDILNFMAAS